MPLSRHVCHVTHPTQNLDRLIWSAKRIYDDKKKGLYVFISWLCITAALLPGVSRKLQLQTLLAWPLQLPAGEEEPKVMSDILYQMQTLTQRWRYLSECFLWVSKKRSLPGEQPSALYCHSHVCQFELHELKASRKLHSAQHCQAPYILPCSEWEEGIQHIRTHATLLATPC